MKLLLISIASLFSMVLGSTFDIGPTFRSHKNIMFSCMFGGTSHVNWVLNILEELSLRGHSTFYVTKEAQLKYANDYPSIQVHSIGPSISKEEHEKISNKIATEPSIELIRGILERGVENFPLEYTSNLKFIRENNIDLVICDMLNDPCIEASIQARIPFITSTTFPQGKDSSAPYINNDLSTMKSPTTEFMSLKERINDMIKPLKYLFLLRKPIQQRKKIYKRFGLKATLPGNLKAKDSIKFVNSAFGFEQGRPLGPLVEFVGPILPKTYPVLTPELHSFLETHTRVAYVAFGQHAVASQLDGQLVLTGLLEAIENNDIDGIIWGTRGIRNLFPSYITTKSNTTYSIDAFYQGTANVMLVHWTPQMAILCHPSTQLFVTHGGAGSLYESFYAGVRVIVYPFLGDQPGAAITAEKNGVGLKLDRKSSQSKANAIIHRVARDEDGQFQLNTKKFKALVQIRSKRGPKRAADIVEEVLFMHKDGQIPHRWDVKRNMTFIKANNIDIYSFFLVFICCFGYGIKSFFTVPQKIKTV